MKLIRKVLRKIYYTIKGKPPTDEEIAAHLITRIRNGGGVVGENVDIIASSIDMGEPYLLSIGNNVTITGVKILTHDASFKKKTGYTRVGKVHIGNNVFIGAGCIILPNVTIGDNCIIGAGTIVVKDVPENSVAVGNPMRIISTYEQSLEKNEEKMKTVPVVDMAPKDILKDKDVIERLIKSGNGYVL